jgi:purine-binding chemotaxis protein CheW
VVRCAVGNESFAVSLDQVRGFHRADRLQPGGEGGCAGQLLTEGGNIPVFALANLLGRPGVSAVAPSRALSHIILLKTEHGAWGLLPDSVSWASRLEAESVRPLPPLLRLWPEIPARSILLGERELHLLLQPTLLHPNAVAPGPTTAEASDEDSLNGGSASPGDVRDRVIVVALTDPAPGERPLAAGLSLGLVEEIVELLPLTPVPRAPAFLLGLAAWRGNPLPVLDLSFRMGLGPTPQERRSCILVIRGGTAGLVGLLVRPGLRVIALPVEHTACERPLPLDRSFVQGAVELSQETLVVPNLSRVLAADCGSPGAPHSGE